MIRPAPKIILLVGIGVVACLGVLLFPLLPVLLNGISIVFDTTWWLFVNLIIILLIAVLVAGVFAPLEALGWWAGWYGDEIETIQHPGNLVEPFPIDLKVTRYVVYLDGISQAQFESLPEVETFLDALALKLPDDIVLIKGIMSYSVLNRPLTEDRLMAFFWRLADRLQMNPTGGIIGALIAATINIRNVLIVCVAADQRYGPIYNQGTAQVIYNSLINYGYQPGSGIPITLVGYSGGGQMAMGAAPYLRRSLKIPLEVISLSGVISGNHNFLELEHLYHLVGGKDWVEKEGPILFPRRWKLFALSYWNRAKRRGKISFISLGDQVGHNASGGPMDDRALLPDGRTHLQQTVDIISDIIQDNSPLGQTTTQIQPSNYERYQQAAFNQPSYYPLNQSVDLNAYRAIAPWMGRLILPAREHRHRLKGVWLEVHHAPPAYQQLIGQVVILRWSNSLRVRRYRRAATKDVHFSEDAQYSQNQGNVHPYRIDHWQQVDPLESLAGARPHDDVIVRLKEPVTVEVLDQSSAAHPVLQPAPAVLLISHEPVQITGRFYGLVRVLHPLSDAPAVPPQGDRAVALEQFEVVHFNRSSGQFDGAREMVCFPQVVFDKHHGSFPSTPFNIEKSPANAAGWYIYGAKNAAGMFVVQSIAPRRLLRLQPDQMIAGETASWNYLKKQAWNDRAKGTVRSVLLCPTAESTSELDLATHCPAEANYILPSEMPSCLDWQAGDRALLLHVYGGIGGNQKEPAAGTPIFFGHFAYGVATVIREPLADELSFDIEYYQVYTHNTDGIIAGTIAWNCFLGDRQFGWLGRRPVCDILIKLDALTENYVLPGQPSALDTLIAQLETMTARYRIGDGTGGTYVGAAHNCSQDSNQALYAALKDIQSAIGSSLDVQEWLLQNSASAQRFRKIVKLGTSIKRELLPFGTARADWQTGEGTLGISPEEDALQNIRMGLMSWRTLLPRLASETIAKLFLEQGASIWILRTNQVGGYDPNIDPVVPTAIGW